MGRTLPSAARPRTTVFAIGLLAAATGALGAWAPAAPAAPVTLPTCNNFTVVPVTLYCNNFEVLVGPGWAPAAMTRAPNGQRFLGEFSNQAVSLSLPVPVVPGLLDVEFDLYVIRSWDGNDLGVGPDIFELRQAGGPVLLRTTFSNCHNLQRQAFPGMFPGGAFLPATGAAALGTLGYNQICVPAAATDATYHLSATFPNLTPTLTLVFTGVGLQNIEDESWGIDNVKISL